MDNCVEAMQDVACSGNSEIPCAALLLKEKISWLCCLHPLNMRMRGARNQYSLCMQLQHAKSHGKI